MVERQKALVLAQKKDTAELELIEVQKEVALLKRDTLKMKNELLRMKCQEMSFQQLNELIPDENDPTKFVVKILNPEV